jgi:hypothetical protein
MSKFEEIEKTSLFMSVFSRIDEDSGNFINQPSILGGEGYFQDEHAKDSVEHAFGQLNLPDLFQQFDFVLNVAFYLPVKLNEDLKISPNYWMVKAKYENIFAMYLILAPYSDLNITALNLDLSDLVVDYSGVATRTALMKPVPEKKSRLMDMSINPELAEATDLLLQRIYYRLFLDRSLSGGPEKPTKPANLVAILIQEATVSRGWIDLESNRVYTKKDKADNPDILRPAPPVLTIDDCWFLFPPSLKGEHANYHAPINLRYLFQASHLPVDLNMAYFRLNPDIFQEILPLPTKSIFTYRDSDDVISLFSHHREIKTQDGSEKQDLKIQIVTGISDSRMVGDEFFSEMAMRIVIRDIEDGFKKNYSLEKIFSKNMQLASWHKSVTYDVKGETTPEGLTSWQNMEIDKQRGG